VIAWLGAQLKINSKILGYTFEKFFELFRIYHDWRVLPLIGGVWIEGSINKLLSIFKHFI